MANHATQCPEPELASHLYEHYAEPQAWRLAPGAAECAAALVAAGVRVGLVDNADSRMRPILGGLGVLDWLLDPGDAVLSCEAGL